MKFVLIGKKLGHSQSVQVHKLLADYDYSLRELEPDQIKNFIYDEAPLLGGFNITIPYKETVIPYLSSITNEAKEIGAVNTVKVCADGSLTGFNTDCAGLRRLLISAGFCLTGKKVVILGSGGASKTAVFVAKSENASQVTVISRTGRDNYENIARHADADYIINATPCGMFPEIDQTPVSLKVFKDLSGVADMIYNPDRTTLLLEAEELGIPRVNGLEMLVAQAAEAARIFTGKDISKAKVSEVISIMRQNNRNIVLIGMPGCGKSTVASKLVQLLPDKKNVDTDSIIEETEGATIPEIFARNGEAYFRNAETAVIRKLAGMHSLVISTGGGAVLRNENIAMLKHNGEIVFINRDLDKLARGNRPLASDDISLKRIFRERLPIYFRACDYEVDGNDYSTEMKIISKLKLTQRHT